VPNVSNANADVLVIGAGVSGLSTALTLLRSGLDVLVYAADPPLRTTSAAAGAIWGVHLAGADERAGGWAATTLDRFRELTANPASGVRETHGIVTAIAADAEPPEFTRGAGPLTPCDPRTLPDGFGCGWSYSAPLINMPVYLDYLLDEVLAAGGRVHLGRRLTGPADAADYSPAPVIVNCAGIGARDLVPDPDLTPVRGQVVVVANPGLTEFFAGERDEPDEVTYIFPHGATVVLGGTLQPGNASTRPDPATAQRILRHCAAIEPRLASAPILAHRVGLRPVRPQVRLGPRPVDTNRHWIDNYGHGGAGVTLSWACAQAVAMHTAIC
jgi:D-amino-acid oxidase